MCPGSDGGAELPGITRGKTGPPLSSAAETKPSLQRLGSLKHLAGKSVPENRVRFALNLTLRDLQKIRQGLGSLTLYALLYWDVRGLSETTYQIHWIVCAEEIGGLGKSGECSVLYSHIA